MSVLIGDAALPSDPVRLIEPSVKTGVSSAVIVDDATLIHTAQFLPSAEQLLSKPASAREQLSSVLGQLHERLAEAGSATIVKLNLYVTSEDVAAQVLEALPSYFHGDFQPAVSLVVTRLPISGACVSADAVACRTGERPRSVAHSSGVSLLPPGSRIYVSGQAEPSEDLAEATRKTLKSLHDTLAFLGRSDADIVHLKVFMQPMHEADVVREQIASFFEGKPVPPPILVEWKSSATTPIEIELIAWGGVPAENAPAMEFLTPPGMTASPVYSRVCRINDPRTIFVSGLYASDRTPVLPGASADAEVQTVFTSLERILRLAGSDLRHLAKATYYVSTDEISASLNQLRPRYYDPVRPPAASKAMVDSVGMMGLRLTMDMIAVPNSTATQR